MPSGTIWSKFLPKLARFAPAALPGAAPRRQGVAAEGRSCEIRSPKDPLMTPPRAAGATGAHLASFGTNSGQIVPDGIIMVPDGIIMVPDGINALY